MINFNDGKRDYLLDVKANKTYSTFQTYQSMLNRFGKYLSAVERQDDPDMEFALSLQVLTEYKQSLSKQGIKKNGGLLGQSVRGVMGPIKGLCVYLIRMQYMEPNENPFKKIEFPSKSDPVRLRVYDEEVMELLKATQRQRCPKKIALSMLVMSTLIHAGVRAAEFQNIEVNHLNFDQETLEVRYGKGRKSRLLHPAKEFWIAARRWMPFRDAMRCSHNYLFALGPKTRMNDESLRKHVEDIKAIAGLKDHDNIHPHRLRGWYATHLSKNGASVLQIQGVLGHAHAQTTFAYLYNNGDGATVMKTLGSFGPANWGEKAPVQAAAPVETPTAPVQAAPPVQAERVRQSPSMVSERKSQRRMSRSETR
ncbi:MAG: tyrosine-type recombinase/integrase [Janthinobacterium lividum]